MKIKSVCPLYWTVTVFAVLYFVQPGLLLRACMPNPTNYWPASVSRAVPVDQANVVPIIDERITPTDNDDQPRPKVWGLVIAFIIAICVIAYIISQIIRLLDKVIPPEKKPDPPPNSGNTNYPPVVVNPSGGPGPAVAVVKKLDAKSLAYTATNGCSITNYNIVTYQFPNTWEKNSSNLIFDHYWSVTMESTTDMQKWEDSHYQVECFYSTGVGVLYRYRHYGTNFYQCYYRSDYIATNHAAPAYFDLTDRPYQPMQFFRLVSQ